jgi:hypothetical protein
MAIEKIKILGAILELPAEQHCQFSQFGPMFEVNGLNWHCCLASSSKMAPRILIFSIAFLRFLRSNTYHNSNWLKICIGI